MKKLFLLLFMCLLITGCGSKETREVAMISDFETTAMNKGCSVQTNLIRYNNIDYINESALATYGDVEIEMVV